MTVFRWGRACSSVLIVFGLLLTACGGEQPESPYIEGQRIIAPLNQQWQFALSEPDAVASVPDKKWKDVALPHSWNNRDGQDGGDDYHRGTGIYRRALLLDERYAGKKLYLHFDGAAINSKVYVNGLLAGSHKGSYGAFRFDISELATIGESNLIEVQVSNIEDDQVAPLSADFTFFGGLYRRVRLIATDPVHIDAMNYASSGVFWSQDSVSSERAELTVRTVVANESAASENLVITAQLIDSEGAIVVNTRRDITTPAGETVPLELKLALDEPRLWHGRLDPYLYQATVTVSREDQILDSVSEPLGLRFFHVDPDKGFFLNGESYPLHGVNRMPDFLGKGTAISREDHERDIQLMLEVGSTSIRLGHQQRDPFVYRRADETGLVVWAEIPLINRIQDTPEFSENVQQQALELIRQNYNRASIAVWGLYNEITLKPGPNPRPLVNALNALVKREDPGRLTTAAIAAEAGLEDTLATAPDLISFNRYDGWYYGDFPDFTRFLDHLRAEAPQLRVGISEFGAGASVKFQTDTPVMQDHSEQYQALYHEAYWESLEQRPWIWGKYVWVLADFAVDNRNEGDTPGRNDKGLVTFDRQTKKDAFYWYQANWSEAPMLYITSRRHSERNRGKIAIKVYSNQAEVELRVNGESLGRKKRGPLPRFTWDAVPLVMGENTVEAITHSAQGELTDEVKFTRVNSDDTSISSSILGIDVAAGKIYNPPFGIELDELTALLTLPDESQLGVVDADKNSPLVPGMHLRVTAQDGSTSRDYQLAQAPISVAKPVWASAEISANLSIGPFDIPVMSAAMANDGIVKKSSEGLTDVNIWNTMGGNKHWWKVDLGADYYLQGIEIVWPQHAKMIDPGPMAYSVETAENFEQTFDNFAESYIERVDQRNNNKPGTTDDQLGVVGRYVRVRLLQSGISVDTPLVGKYPVYGAEEITIIGGLLYSEDLDIDYRQHTIAIPTGLNTGELSDRLQPVKGGSLEILGTDGTPLLQQQRVQPGSLVIARDATGQLAESYKVQ